MTDQGQSSQRRTCYFSGNVQGVGFRYMTKNLAQRFDVRGYVRNLPDGRVELVMEGPQQEMDQLVEAIQQQMSGYVRNVEARHEPATGEFTHFSIRH